MKSKIRSRVPSALMLLVLLASPSLPQSMGKQEPLGIVVTNKPEQPVEVAQSPSAYSQFIDPVNGLPADELVRYTLAHNGELAAATQMIAEARGRLRQAGLRANPMI